MSAVQFSLDFELVFPAAFDGSGFALSTFQKVSALSHKSKQLTSRGDLV